MIDQIVASLARDRLLLFIVVMSLLGVIVLFRLKGLDNGVSFIEQMLVFFAGTFAGILKGSSATNQSL